MKRFTVCDFVLPILALCLLLGLFFVFGPCGIKEDGGWMTCHWAGQALRGIAALELALALLHLIPAPHERKIGLDMALIGTSISGIGAVLGVALAALTAFPFTGLIRSSLGLPYLLPSAGRIALLAAGTLLLSVAAGALSSAAAVRKLNQIDPGFALREGA